VGDAVQAPTSPKSDDLSAVVFGGGGEGGLSQINVRQEF
jgi:hypothetical protein